jgi:Na+/H+-translocating membrane pyrophosphatase
MIVLQGEEGTESPIQTHVFFLIGAVLVKDATFFGLAVCLSAFSVLSRVTDASTPFVLLGDAAVVALFFDFSFFGLLLALFALPWSD